MRYPCTSQAIDGFLLVLDDQANILYVSEAISGYVGLNSVQCTTHILSNFAWYIPSLVNQTAPFPSTGCIASSKGKVWFTRLGTYLSVPGMQGLQHIGLSLQHAW